jgi:hypothetical protein
MTYLFRMKTFYARLKTHLNKSDANYKRVLEIGRIIQFFADSHRTYKNAFIMKHTIKCENFVLCAIIIVLICNKVFYHNLMFVFSLF